MSITITEVRNAQSLQADNLRMVVEINHPIHGWIPYGIDPSDADTTIDNYEVMALIGSDFAAYVPPTQEELDAQAARSNRSLRNTLLETEVDPIVGNALRWSALSSEEQAALGVYRQALLDVPQQAGFPNTHTWPTL
tara:strand:+ start:492 stop:902 length:411 start_codon:yes stop_codon:yes gene_type:complete